MPLNAMCSSRCEMPCSLGFSSRPPTPVQTPRAAVSRCGMESVTTVRPDGSLGNVDAHPATPCLAASADRADESLDFRRIVFHHRDVFGFGQQAVEPGRQLRLHRRRRLRPRRGISPGARSSSTTCWESRNRNCRDRPPPALTNRGVRIDELTGLAPGGADRSRGFGLVGAAGVELLADRSQRRVGQHEAAGLFQRGHQPANAGGIAAAGLEQQPLEIRGDLDVHRGRSRGMDLAHFVDAGLERARQDIVDVGGDAQRANRQAHAFCDIASENIAEIAGRNGEIHHARRRTERNRRCEVVDHLGHDARPVDRVDARQRDRIAKAAIAEQRLHDSLAIVKSARLRSPARGRWRWRPTSSSSAAARRKSGRSETALSCRHCRGLQTHRLRPHRYRLMSRPRWWCAVRAWPVST